MIRNVVIGVLVVVLVGTGLWGYREHDEKNAVLIQSENNYQRAFHDLTYQVDLLHDEIGSTLAMNSKERLSPSLADVWRITAEAQNDLGQLPLVLMPFSKTEEFLHKVGDFSYKHAIRDLDQEPLGEESYEDLKTLYSQSEEIQNELRKVQSMVLDDHLRWMDVDLALASEKEPLDNGIVNGFKIMDEKVAGFEEVTFASESGGLAGEDEAIAERIGDEKKVNKEEALEIASEFTDKELTDNTQITETGEGLAYEAYSLTFPDPSHGTNVTMDITKRGGHPVWMLNEREVQRESISLNEASENAEEFLEERGYQHMQLTDSKQYDNVGVFQFVYLDDTVRMYPDEIVVEVALDEGDVIAFEAFQYLANHTEDRDTDMSLTKEEAEERLNPNLDIKEHHHAVIENQLGEEVICHAFYGTINKDTYRVFINGNNGREEQVEKLANPEPKYD